jgi:hypothetical protein
MGKMPDDIWKHEAEPRRKATLEKIDKEYREL